MRVMLTALEFGVDFAIVGILHDTIEDTNLTIDQLKEEFPKEITDAVGLLTTTLEVPYDNYLAALKINNIARIVKIIDIEDNLSDSPTERQREKYRKALAFLRGM